MHYQLERELLMQENFSKQREISEFQKKLWDAVSTNEKILMFVGPCHFNDFERVCIWNSQPFSASVYGETDENWCIESEKNFWVKLLPRQKLKIAEKIVQPLKKVEKEFKKV